MLSPKKKGGKLRERELTGSEVTILLASVHALGQVPYGSVYKNKGHIHLYLALLFHSNTH